MTTKQHDCSHVGCEDCRPLQVMMFSATLHSDEVKEIAKRICHQPILIDLKVCSRMISCTQKRHSPACSTRAAEYSSGHVTTRPCRNIPFASCQGHSRYVCTARHMLCTEKCLPYQKVCCGASYLKLCGKVRHLNQPCLYKSTICMEAFWCRARK